MFVQQVGEPDVGFDHVLIQLIKRDDEIRSSLIGVPPRLWSCTCMFVEPD